MGLGGFSGKLSNPLENQRETGIFAEENVEIKDMRQQN